MIDQAERRKTVRQLLLALLAVLYFFLGAEPLARELTTMPVWRSGFVELMATDSGDDDIAFTMGDWFGFFRRDGHLTMSAFALGGAELTDWAYIPLGNRSATTDAFELYSKNADRLGYVQGGQPFFSAGRLFTAHIDGTGLNAHDRSGAIEWKYAFPSHLSAFAANDQIVVGGTIDGRVEAVGADGSRLLHFAPGGSRLPIILGLAVSPSSAWIALFSGIDAQRLVVLGKGRSDYRVVSHRYLESDFREPARVAILANERHVLYRRADGIGVWDVNGTIDAVLPVQADDFDVHYDAERDLGYIVAYRAGESELVVFRPPAKLIGRMVLGSRRVILRIEGEAIYMASPLAVARFDFSKE